MFVVIRAAGWRKRTCDWSKFVSSMLKISLSYWVPMFRSSCSIKFSKFGSKVLFRKVRKLRMPDLGLGILWYMVVYCCILWYIVVYCCILWYIVVHLSADRNGRPVRSLLKSVIKLHANLGFYCNIAVWWLLSWYFRLKFVTMKLK
jgi:hypothetical protein